MKRAHLWFFLSVGLLLAVTLAACGETSAPGTQGPGRAAATTATVTSAPPIVMVKMVKVKSAKVSGKSTQVLGDLKGKTLYYFKADSANQIACTGSCAQLWPPLLVVSGTPAAQTTLSGTFGVINGANGRQATYNDHPLYTYAKDEDSEDAYGQGINGKWFAATPNLSVQS